MLLSRLWSFLALAPAPPSSKIILGFLGDYTCKSNPFDLHSLFNSSFTHIAYSKLQKGEEEKSLIIRNAQVLSEFSSSMKERSFEIGTSIASNELQLETVSLVAMFARDNSLSFIVLQWKGSFEIEAVEYLIKHGIKIILERNQDSTVPLELLVLCTWTISHLAEVKAISDTLVDYEIKVKEQLRKIIISSPQGSLIAPFDLAPTVPQASDVASWKESGNVLEWPTFTDTVKARIVLECKDYISIFIDGCQSEGLAGVAFYNVALYWQEE
jgi:hypothetical protein